MLPDVRDQRLGEQVAGAVSFRQQRPNLGCGNVELRHGEGRNAPGRCRREIANVGTQSRQEDFGQRRRQGVCFDRIARPVRDTDMRQFEQRLPAMPAGHPGEGVGADEQDERS